MGKHTQRVIFVGLALKWLRTKKHVQTNFFNRSIDFNCDENVSNFWLFQTFILWKNFDINQVNIFPLNLRYPKNTPIKRWLHFNFKCEFLFSLLVYFDKSVDFCRYSYVHHAKCLMDGFGDFWKLIISKKKKKKKKKKKPNYCQFQSWITMLQSF